MKIQESAENYLETILILHNRLGQVRSIDIVNELSFSKPSVSIAMKNLRNNGYIQMDKDGYITLLDKGARIAEKIYERHILLTEWLTALGVDPEIAAKDACRMEHVISSESFDKLKEHVKKHK
ncbi:MAG: metal-dependent transcriptional regulator [Lachnospiraceae bacterium]|nr:metal-dependent transcriptional regulator [Lachnospiraceae bacterium]MCI9546063.1 metal-dependent transcriptional regulator [Lachnospiraceae bacterium]